MKLFATFSVASPQRFANLYAINNLVQPSTDIQPFGYDILLDP